MNPRIEEIGRQLHDLYRRQNVNDQAARINSLLRELREICPDPTFEEALSIVLSIARYSCVYAQRLLRAPILPDIQSASHIRAIWPYLPKTWHSERKFLLQKLAELAKDKEELVGYLREFDVI